MVACSANTDRNSEHVEVLRPIRAHLWIDAVHANVLDVKRGHCICVP